MEDKKNEIAQTAGGDMAQEGGVGQAMNETGGPAGDAAGTVAYGPAGDTAGTGACGPGGETQGAGSGVGSTRSKKDSYMDGFKKKHPDWQDDDEEGFYGALSEDDAARDEEMNGYKSRESEIAGALQGSPMNAALFIEAANGTPIPLALLKEYPEEIKAWMDDPENTDAIQKVFEAQAQKLAQDKELEAEAQKNLDESNAMIDEMIANGEIADDNEANSLLEMLGKISVGLTMNHVEKEWLLAAKKAMGYDKDVAAAKTQGEIDGRNAKITAQRKDQQRGSQTHSGLGSANAGQTMSRRETAAAGGGNSGKRDMWAGMKTNKLS